MKGLHMKLSGKSAIVTGAGKSLGRAIAFGLAREGAHVALVTRASDQTDIVNDIKALGSRAINLHCELTDADSVSEMVAHTVSTFGAVDILVNNAGMSVRGPLETLAVEDWDRVFGVNVKGVFLCSVAAAKQMMQQRNGRIITIAGATAHQCAAEFGAYGPSKAAVVNLTKQMAVEWGKYNIRVNGVSPGPVMDYESLNGLNDNRLEQRLKKTPLGRVADPEDVAKTVLFLASDESKSITGQMIVVDGGGILTWYLNS